MDRSGSSKRKAVGPVVEMIGGGYDPATYYGPGGRGISQASIRRAGRGRAAVLCRVLWDLWTRQRGRDRAGAASEPRFPVLLVPERAGDGAHGSGVCEDE